MYDKVFANALKLVKNKLLPITPLLEDILVEYETTSKSIEQN